MLRISSRRFQIALLCLLLLGVLTITGSEVNAFTGDEALTRISEAGSTLKIAFTRVYEAETAGGNVSSLMPQLNLAGDALSSAEASYEHEDFDGAIVSANQSITLAQNVETEAATLKNQATSSSTDWWKIVAFSSLGSAVFLVALGLIWRRFKRRYLRRIRSLKPEVAKQ